MISRLYKYGVLTFLLIAGAAENSGGEEGQEQAVWDNDKVVVERNIFRRDRRRAPKTVFAPAKEPPPRPERYIVLTGIVQQSKGHIAFLEDTRTGTTTRVRIGDSVAEGKLKDITLDYVEYESNGDVARIEIGKNLDGSVSTPAIPQESSEEDGTPDVPAAGTPGDGAAAGGDEAAILERLRQKREKELGE